MSTLYEMTDIARQLYAMIDNDEIDDQTVADTLEAIGVSGKLEDYCKVIRQFEADAEAYKAEKMRLAANQKRAETLVDKLKSAISEYLTAANKTEQKSGIFTMKLRTNKAVVIDDIFAVDEQYLRYAEPTADKTAIKKAIDGGAAISGAHIEERKSLNIK